MSLQRQLSKIAKNSILYVDKGIIVVNKPSGCQGGRQQEQHQGNSGRDFEKFLEGIRVQLDLPTSPIQVHRLDKLTTGAYILAQSPQHAKDLVNQFRSRTLKKTYLALVRAGAKSFEHDKGTISDKLFTGDDGVRIDRRWGAEALTDWEVMGSSDTVPLSLLRLTLHTGLKHQLRVHLSQGLQTPILGDSLYSHKPPVPTIAKLIPRHIYVGPSPNPTPADLLNAKMFLHASHISLFRYRKSGKRFRLGVTSPLPREFLEICTSAGLARHLTPEHIHGGLDVDDAPWPKEDQVKGVRGRWMGDGGSWSPKEVDEEEDA